MTQYISAAMAFGGSGATPLPTVALDFANGQRFAISSTAVNSAAINAVLVAIRLDVDGFFKIGGTASATVAGSWPLSATETFFIPINPGSTISIVTSSAAGNAYIMPAL